MSDANDVLAGTGEPSSASNILDNFEPEAEAQPERRPQREPETESDGQGDDDADLLLDEDLAEPEPEKAPKDTDDDGLDTLRDGTKVSKKDLKEAYENRRNFERERAAFEAERQEMQATAQRLGQQETLFQAFIQQQVEALPPEPDPKLARENPGEFLHRQTLRHQAIEKLRNAVQSYQESRTTQSAEQAKSYNEHLAQEQSRLFEKMPELRDPAKREAFGKEILEGAQHYGFSAEDVGAASDHRLMLMLRDANAYRRAKANRETAKAQAAEKARNAAEVVAPAAPGRRVSAAERQSAVTREQVSRLAKTGSAKDAEAFLSRFE